MTTKKQLTPEQIAVLNLMVNGAFSSIAIHAIGDRVSKGIHKVADATQFATDKTAYAAGTRTDSPWRDSDCDHNRHGMLSDKVIEYDWNVVSESVQANVHASRSIAFV